MGGLLFRAADRATTPHVLPSDGSRVIRDELQSYEQVPLPRDVRWLRALGEPVMMRGIMRHLQGDRR